VGCHDIQGIPQVGSIVHREYIYIYIYIYIFLISFCFKRNFIDKRNCARVFLTNNPQISRSRRGMGRIDLSRDETRSSGLVIGQSRSYGSTKK